MLYVIATLLHTRKDLLFFIAFKFLNQTITSMSTFLAKGLEFVSCLVSSICISDGSNLLNVDSLLSHPSLEIP